MLALLSDDTGQISLHHLPHQFAERDAVVPSENLVCLRGVPQQRSHLGGADVSWVDPHDGGTRRSVDRHLVPALSPPLDAGAEVAERALDKFANRMRLAGSKHKIVGLVLLEHQPHALDKVTRMAPVAPRLEVPNVKDLLDPMMDCGDRAGDLATDERHQGNAAAGDNALLPEVSLPRAQTHRL